MARFFGREKEAAPFLESARATLGLLTEIGRGSTAKGVESLSRLTKRPVQVKDAAAAIVPARSLVPVLAAVADAQTLAAMPVENGFGVIALGGESSLRLVDLLLGQPPGSSHEMNELAKSAIAETANIALNQMVTQVAKMSGGAIKTGVPETSFKARERIAELARAPAGREHAIVVETLFDEPETRVSGRMALVLFL